MTAEKLDVAKAENYLKQFIELDTDESGIGSYTLENYILCRIALVRLNSYLLGQQQAAMYIRLFH